jgi:hypothetical protein
MKTLVTTGLLALTLSGCALPSAYRQTHGLIGLPLSEATARYGPPDQPVTGGAGAYSWGQGRLTGACRLAVRTDASGRIAKASVIGIGFDTCKTILKPRRHG